MKSLVIGVAGGSASGKTTFAYRLYEAFKDDALIISQDDYYKDQSHKTMEQRVLTNYDHPDAFDNDLLIEHINMLKDGIAIEKPIYDYKEHTRSSKVTHVEPKRIIIIEGIFVLASELINICDIKVFVRTPDDIRFIRRLVRDVNERGRSVESVVSQYLTTVRPMHIAFIEPSQDKADIIVPADRENDVAIDILIAKMTSILD